jgi:hypothetical protein
VIDDGEHVDGNHGRIALHELAESLFARQLNDVDPVCFDLEHCRIGESAEAVNRSRQRLCCSAKGAGRGVPDQLKHAAVLFHERHDSLQTALRCLNGKPRGEPGQSVETAARGLPDLDVGQGCEATERTFVVVALRERELQRGGAIWRDADDGL